MNWLLKRIGRRQKKAFSLLPVYLVLLLHLLLASVGYFHDTLSLSTTFLFRYATNPDVAHIPRPFCREFTTTELHRAPSEAALRCAKSPVLTFQGKTSSLAKSFTISR